jgi:integrase
MKRRSQRHRGVYQRCRDGECPPKGERCSRHTWTYQIELPERNGKRRIVTKGGFPSATVAARARADLLKQHRDGTAPTDARMTFAEWVRRWLAERIAAGELRPSTARSYRDLAEQHLLPRVGHRRLAELRGAHLTSVYRQVVADRNAEIEEVTGRNAKWLAVNPGKRPPYPVPRVISPATVRRIHAVASGALTAARKGGLLAVNPAPDAELPKTAKVKVKPWSPEQFARYLDAVKGEGRWYYTAFALVGLTGLRRGELCGLGWVDVDLDAGTVTVNNTRVSVGYKVHEGAAKSDAGQGRVVYLGPAGVALLKAWRRVQAEQRLAAGPAYCDDGWLIADELGHPIHPDLVSKSWTRLATKAGLPSVKLHAGRHFYAAALISSGLDISSVSKLLGHSSIGITSDVYGSLFEKAARDAGQAVENMIPGISLANGAE